MPQNNDARVPASSYQRSCSSGHKDKNGFRGETWNDSGETWNDSGEKRPRIMSGVACSKLFCIELLSEFDVEGFVLTLWQDGDSEVEGFHVSY